MNDFLAIEQFAVNVPAGEVLFREGDEGNDMFVIQSGTVEIRRQIGNRIRTLAVLSSGDFFGEMAIINNRPRSATVVVKTDAKLIVVERSTFEVMLAAKAEIAVRMIRTMGARLEQTNQQVELLLLKDSNHRVVQCLRRLAEETDLRGGAVILNVNDEQIAARVALPQSEVRKILARLSTARLIVSAYDAGLEQDGYLIPEVGRLLEFLEFLELKERFDHSQKTTE